MGRYRVPRIRLASAVLSGSSATNTTPNTVARIARFNTAPVVSARACPRRGSIHYLAEGLAQRIDERPRPGYRARRPACRHPGGELLPLAFSTLAAVQNCE